MERIALVLCVRGPGEWPRGLGFPILPQLFALFEHEGLGFIEIGINARALDRVAGSATGYQIARILLSFASPRNNEIHPHDESVLETTPAVQSAILAAIIIAFQNSQTFLQAQRRSHQRQSRKA